MDLQLKDKTTLVTGASRGLGFATAFALVREGSRSCNRTMLCHYCVSLFRS